MFIKDQPMQPALRALSSKISDMDDLNLPPIAPGELSEKPRGLGY
jgi:twitching motility protein PilT